MRFMEISTWIRGARLKTLPLAIAPVVIGKELYGRIAGARRIVRLVVTAAARKQCGRSED